MPPSTEGAFAKALQARSFAAVYCLYGDDDFRKESGVRDLIAAAVDPATRDFNLDVRAAGELDAETLGSLVATPPMMAERRVVVVRDAPALKKDVRAVLDRHVEASAARAGESDVVLVLVFPSGEKGKPDKLLLERTFSVEFGALDDKRVPRWIAHHVTTEVGATITPEAITLLQQAVGNDLAALASELDKLASYTNLGTIDEDAVAAVVGVRRGETLGDLLDRVAERDVAGALALLPHILEQPKVTGVSIVMALTTQTLALAWGEARLASGLPASRLEGEYFGLLKGASGPYTGRPWGEAVKAWARNVSRWDARSLDAALEALLAADIALKETRISSEEQILSTLLLALCAGDARAVQGRRAARATA
jgi:DNA polymerase-3 subunit delta